MMRLRMLRHVGPAGQRSPAARIDRSIEFLREALKRELAEGARLHEEISAGERP